MLCARFFLEGCEKKKQKTNRRGRIFFSGYLGSDFSSECFLFIASKNEFWRRQDCVLPPAYAHTNIYQYQGMPIRNIIYTKPLRPRVRLAVWPPEVAFPQQSQPDVVVPHVCIHRCIEALTRTSLGHQPHPTPSAAVGPQNRLWTFIFFFQTTTTREPNPTHTHTQHRKKCANPFALFFFFFCSSQNLKNIYRQYVIYIYIYKLIYSIFYIFLICLIFKPS